MSCTNDEDVLDEALAPVAGWRHAMSTTNLESDRVTLDRSNPGYDLIAGTASDLICTRALARHELEPQAGRRKGESVFMANGTVAPKGVSLFSGVPGIRVVKQLRTGNIEIRIAIPNEETKRRWDNRPGQYDESGNSFEGTRDQVLAMPGFEPAWLDGVPVLSGRRWGCRKMEFDGQVVTVEWRASSGRVRVTRTPIKDTGSPHPERVAEVAAWPKSEADFRNRQYDNLLKYTLPDLLYNIRGGSPTTGGYCYDDEVLKEFALIAKQILTLAENGTVHLDQDARRRFLIELLGSDQEPSATPARPRPVLRIVK